MATVTVTVSCADHGEMTRDEPHAAWECTVAGCRRWLPEEKARWLAWRAPDGPPGPFPIVVT
jgi:hypothetical protein